MGGERNALALVPAPGYAVNPFRSDAGGNPDANGGYETYEVLVYTQYYGGNPDYMGQRRAQIVIREPKTPRAAVQSARFHGPFEPLTQASGGRLVGIEPTATAGAFLAWALPATFGAGAAGGATGCTGAGCAAAGWGGRANSASPTASSSVPESDAVSWAGSFTTGPAAWCSAAPAIWAPTRWPRTSASRSGGSRLPRWSDVPRRISSERFAGANGTLASSPAGIADPPRK